MIAAVERAASLHLSPQERGEGAHHIRGELG
jgi:hypothetical protein